MILVRMQPSEIKAALLGALRENGASRKRASEALGVSPGYLFRLLREYTTPREIQAIERELGVSTWAPGRRKRANSAQSRKSAHLE